MRAMLTTLVALTLLSAPADDATFLRRIALDVEGVIPEEREVDAFVRDRDPKKRDRLIDAMLARPGAAARFGREWGLFLLGAPEPMKERRIDRKAFEAWLATAFESAGRWDRLATQMITANDAPASSFLLSNENQAEITGRISSAFLGVRMECAECHDHPEEKYTRRDFWQLAAFFGRTRIRPFGIVDRDRGETHVGDLPELAPPRFIDGSSVEMNDGASMRATLAGLIIDPKSPYFARAFKARAWSMLVGNDRPPASLDAPDLRLDAIYRAVLRSPEYQSSDYRARMLSPDQLADSLLRASGLSVTLREKATRGLIRAFGDDAYVRGEEEGAAIPVQLALMNGPLATRAMRIRGRFDFDTAVRSIFVRTLGREPRQTELEAIAKEGTTREVLEDLQWALINSAELGSNH